MADERFLRTSMLLGQKSMRNLANSTVMIVGLGAVGGYALEAVARSGVGKLILVDFDRFDRTNINRQILALDSSVGRLKTVVAAERVKQINPHCKIEVCEMFVDEKNISQLLDYKPDYVIDAIDSLGSKCCLLEALWLQKIPFVSSMGAALKTDPMQIRFSSLEQSQSCSLAKLVRQNLRKKGVNISQVMCVWSKENSVLAPQDAPDVMMGAGERKPLGSLPTITAIVGLMLANYVILELAKSR